MGHRFAGLPRARLGRGCEQLAGFVAPLVSAGHTVIAFDAPAHGRSDPGRHGERSTIPELGDALLASAAAHGTPHAVIAHSVGAVAVAYALRLGLAPERVVLVAPVADPRRSIDAFAGRLGLTPEVKEGLEHAAEEVTGYPLAVFDLTVLPAAVTPPPTLIIHDHDDREIGFENGVDIADAWPDARLLATEGLGHRRILHSEPVINEIVRFVGAGRSGPWTGGS